MTCTDLNQVFRFVTKEGAVHVCRDAECHVLHEQRTFFSNSACDQMITLKCNGRLSGSNARDVKASNNSCGN